MANITGLLTASTSASDLLLKSTWLLDSVGVSTTGTLGALAAGVASWKMMKRTVLIFIFIHSDIKVFISLIHEWISRSH